MYPSLQLGENMNKPLQVMPNNTLLEESLLGCLITDVEQFWKVEPYITNQMYFIVQKIEDCTNL
jgi:hypothetical protein